MENGSHSTTTQTTTPAASRCDGHTAGTHLQPLHVVSVCSEQDCTTKRALGHVVHVRHWRSVVRVGATDWNFPTAHVDACVHTRSEVSVGAPVWYESALQTRAVAQRVSCPDWTLNVTPSSQEPHSRLVAGEGRRVSCSPARHWRTGWQVSLCPVATLNVTIS